MRDALAVVSWQGYIRFQGEELESRSTLWQVCYGLPGISRVGIVRRLNGVQEKNERDPDKMKQM